MIRVLLVDDQALLRGSLRVLVDATPGMVAVGEAGSGREAVDLARRLVPDVVVMDVRMPDGDGIEATRAICGDPATAGAEVLVLTTFDLDEYVYGALRSGAAGFLLKSAPPAELLAAIRVLARGDAMLAPSVTRRLIARFAVGTPPVRPVVSVSEARLTRRERDVLLKVASGQSNSEIADSLSVNINTVKSHVSHLMDKLGARHRAQLVVFAYESGFVRAAPPGDGLPPG